MDKHDRFQPKNNAELIGGFRCQLTDDESNLWHEFVIGTPALMDLRGNERRLRALVAQQHGTSANMGSIIIGIQEAQSVIKERLYEIGKKWYADLIEAAVPT